MECVLLPINALNLILVILMTVISIKYLLSSSLIDLYQRLGVTIVILKWVSTFFIFLKYMFQFEEYMQIDDIGKLINPDGEKSRAEQLQYYY